MDRDRNPLPGETAPGDTADEAEGAAHAPGPERGADRAEPAPPHTTSHGTDAPNYQARPDDVKDDARPAE